MRKLLSISRINSRLTTKKLKNWRNRLMRRRRRMVSLALCGYDPRPLNWGHPSLGKIWSAKVETDCRNLD
jgi:hypothetical protein